HRKIDRNARKVRQGDALRSRHLAPGGRQGGSEIVLEVEIDHVANDLREVQRLRRARRIALALDVHRRQVQQLVVRQNAFLDLVQREARVSRRGGGRRKSLRRRFLSRRRRHDKPRKANGYRQRSLKGTPASHGSKSSLTITNTSDEVDRTI